MKKKIAVYTISALVAVVALGGLVAMGLQSVITKSSFWDPSVFGDYMTYAYGAVLAALGCVLYLALSKNEGKSSKNMLKGKAKRLEGGLENSRFLTDSERDDLFPRKQYNKLDAEKKDGISVYAVYNAKKKDMDVNICAPAHGLIIGATGSGKTTTFINPVIQILGHSSAGSSIICTDPKGELFQMHSKLLQERGYKVMVLDLRDPYSSYRWNPLGDIYDRYQQYVHLGDEIYQHTDDVEKTSLELLHPLEKYSETWYEFEGKAYGTAESLFNYIRVEKQKIYDELFEDLSDLISVICPVESADDPVWEKGARSIVLATCLAMLEDSENPVLEMTKDKFCFYNIAKAIGNSENEFDALKKYFQGRSKLSKAVGISRQVISAADQTLSSYMSIAFDKMSMFNDEGLCALTADTDIDPYKFGDEPTALFLKIPDEKDTRHALAGVFILSIYKALIKVASGREDLSLPRNVYFLLDEFGNMPKIDKFDKMITVGRSRKIWFHMVVQSYAQLNNVYGDTVANIVKSNCGIKMFIGSNDIETCDEFSKLCGNMTISTTSVSGAVGGSQGVNYSSQIQERPLIYPSELMKLNNKKDTGNAIIVTFGNFPLRTKFTPSYKCPLYEMGQMDLSDVRSNVFFGDEIFYDLQERNYLILEAPPEEETPAGGVSLASTEEVDDLYAMEEAPVRAQDTQTPGTDVFGADLAAMLAEMEASSTVAGDVEFLLPDQGTQEEAPVVAPQPMQQPMQQPMGYPPMQQPMGYPPMGQPMGAPYPMQGGDAGAMPMMPPMPMYYMPVQGQDGQIAGYYPVCYPPQMYYPPQGQEGQPMQPQMMWSYPPMGQPMGQPQPMQQQAPVQPVPAHSNEQH